MTRTTPQQELEAHQAQTALQLNAAQLLEAQTAKALDAFKRESAAALAKHAQAEEAEAARMRELASKFEEAKQQVRFGWVDVSVAIASPLIYDTTPATPPIPQHHSWPRPTRSSRRPPRRAPSRSAGSRSSRRRRASWRGNRRRRRRPRRRSRRRARGWTRPRARRWVGDVIGLGIWPG